MKRKNRRSNPAYQVVILTNQFWRKPAARLEHDIEIKNARFETIEDVKKEWNHRFDILCKSSNEQDVELSELLRSCKVKHPCGTAACPRCFRIFRKWFYREVSQIAESGRNQRILTIVFYSEMMTTAKLYVFNPTKLHDRLRRMLRRAGFTRPVIGSLEIDYRRQDGQWLPHYHLLCFDRKIARESLRQTLKKNQIPAPKGKSTTPRPLKIQKLRDPGAQLSYLCKSYSKEVSQSMKSGYHSMQSRLGPKEERACLQLKHRLGFSKLLFLYGARVQGPKIAPRVSSTKK